MEIEGTEYRTPGQYINALLTAKGWSQRLISDILNVEETKIYRLVADKNPITAEMALILQDVFGVQAERFLDLQKEYDLAKARITAIPDHKRDMRAQLIGGLPVADMAKRGWLNVDDIHNVPKVEAELARFFNVKSPNEIEILPYAAKKTKVCDDVTPSQLAWLYRVRQIANSMASIHYSARSVQDTIPKLHELLASKEAIRKVPRILADSGICFVIVEPLPASKIDGACLWLDDTHPVIGLSFRFDRIDNFWFVLRHELEHVIRRDGRDAIMLDVNLEEQTNDKGDIPEAERAANNAASEFCIPAKSIESFIARKEPTFTEIDILRFARTQNVHPGIVVGQLQHRTNKYELLRKHLVSVRNLIAPSAIVDGWGNIAPIIS